MYVMKRSACPFCLFLPPSFFQVYWLRTKTNSLFEDAKKAKQKHADALDKKSKRSKDKTDTHDATVKQQFFSSICGVDDDRSSSQHRRLKTSRYIPSLISICKSYFNHGKI
jgi:hypothetical protein